jgi:DNA primase
VIALAQAGFGNAVAPLGTALTENQLELLWRMTGEPVLCFDGDQAGLRAAWRAADLALPMIAAGRTVRFALLPEGQDPDDLVRRSGAEAFAAVLAEARPLADLLWMRETQGGVFDTPERRAELDRRLRELTSRIRDESVRYHYQQEMRERAIAFFGQRGRPNSRGDSRLERRGRAGVSGRLAMTESLARSALIKVIPSKPLLREAALLMALINYPPLFHENSDLVAGLAFENSELIAGLHHVIVDIYATREVETREDVLAALKERNLLETVESLSKQIKDCYLWVAAEGAALEDAREGFRQALALYSRARELKAQAAALQAALAEAIEEGDEPLAAHLMAALKANGEDAAAFERQEALVEGFGVLSGRARG